MGLEDRQYYRDDESWSGRLSFGSQSMVVILVVINCVVFVLDAFSPQVAPDGSRMLSYHLGLKYDYPWFLWNYLTYGFAHSSITSQSGIWHLISNMVTLFFLGRPVEYRLGRIEFLRFYLLSIVIAGVGFALIKLVLQSPFFFIVGASGAVSAVVALFIFMYPRQQILLMGVIPMPAWLLGVLLLLSNFMTAFQPGSHVAWEAHLLGAAFGAVYFQQQWNLSWLSGLNPAGWVRSGPKLRVHHPDDVDDRLKEQADLVLKKISERGEQSLTAKERKILNKYSEQLRQKR